MALFSSERCEGVVRWALIGMVLLSGCRGSEAIRPPVHVDTTSVGCLQSAALTPNAALLLVGQTLQLVAAKGSSGCGLPGGLTFSFASSAPSVASVDSVTGLVRALAPGTAVIIATATTDRGVQATSAITVAPIDLHAGIVSILQDSMPAKLDSLHGTVSVVIALDGGASVVSRADLVISGNGVAVLHGPQITTANTTSYVIAWKTDSISNNTRVFPNGPYAVELQLTFNTGGSQLMQPTINVRVANP